MQTQTDSPLKSLTVKPSTLYGAVAITALLLVLFVISRHNYLFFHAMAEFFAVAVAWGVFMLAWNAREYIKNDALVFLGIAFLFVGLIDMIHLLAYKGMGVFRGGREANLATQLWIAARYLESAGLLIFTLRVDKSLPPRLGLILCGAAASLLLAAIFFWPVFPVCFEEGAGLTPFKIISEYAICLVLAVALYVLARKRRRFAPVVYNRIFAAIALTIASELMFTLYTHVHDVTNMVGHLLKIGAYFMVYMALIRSRVDRPYDFLFGELKQSESNFKYLVDAVPLSIVRFDAEGTVTYVNPHHLKQYGGGVRGPEFFIGKKIYELPGIVSAGMADLVKQVLQGSSYYLPEVYFTSDAGGNAGYMSSRGFPFIEEGRVIGGITMGEDITERKHAQIEQQTTLELLALINASSDLKQLMDNLRPLLQNSSRCHTTAIHLCDTQENSLRNGLCGDILESRFDAQQLCFTRAGSFWTNSFSELMASSEPIRDRVRGCRRCWEEKFESVALIGLRHGGQTLGLLQLADAQPGRFTPQTIALFERLAGYLSIAIKERRDHQALLESQRSLHTLIGNLPGVAFRCAHDSDWTMTFISEGCVALTGYQPDEFIANRVIAFNDIIHPDDRKPVWDRIQERLAAHRHYEIEYRIIDKSGTEKWVWERGQLVDGAAGDVPVLEGFMIDITPKKLAAHKEEALMQRQRAEMAAVTAVAVSPELTSGDIQSLVRRTTELSAVALNVERAGVWLFDETSYNLVCMDLYGASRGVHTSGKVLKKESFVSEFAALQTARYLAADNALTDPRTAEYADQYLESPGLAALLHATIRSEGRNLGILSFEHVGREHAWEADEIAFACQLADQIALVISINEKLEAHAQREQALSQVEEQKQTLESILDGIPDIVCLRAPDHSLIFYNKAAAALIGDQGDHPPLSMRCFELWGRSRPCDECAAALAVHTRHKSTIERYEPLLARWYQINSIPIFDKTGELVMVVEQFHDITNRRQTENELRRLASAIDQAAESIFITDPDGRIVFVNPTFEKTTGYARVEVIGKNPSLLKSGKQTERFYAELWRTLRAGENWTGQITNRKKDGTLYIEKGTISPVTNAKGEIINYVSVRRDVTEEFKLEEKLNQAQKMEAIGTLAGGIAHDFNNILSPMSGLSEMLILDLPEGSQQHDFAEGIYQSVLRARDLVKQILAFSRQSNQERHAIRLQPIIQEALKLVRASLPSSIEIEHDLDKACAPVMADPTQIHQIVMNLITNAFHAMEEKGGALTISLKGERIATEQTRHNLPPGPYACLVVSDTGYGIDSDIIDRIFDPYFTTKGEGKGTGLGLSVIHGIVQSYAGDIQVESEPGRGTTFRVYLPCIEVPETRRERHDATAPVPTGNERILIVDDEEAIVRIVQLSLERLGYHAVSRTASIEALEAFKEAPGNFDLIISDFTMPNMTGDKLTAEIKRIRPDIPVILCTGFSEQLTPERVQAIGASALLLKPLLPSDLARTIRRTLDGETTKS